MTRKRIPERNQFLQNLLLDTRQAVRDWATIGQSAPITDKDGYIVGYKWIIIDERQNKARHTITTDTIATGLTRLLRLAGPGAAQNLRLANRTNGQEGDCTPSDANMVIQCALYGEVRHT